MNPNQVHELQLELEVVKARAREAAQILRAATPDANAGPTNVDEYARRAARHIETLEANVALLRKALCDKAHAVEGGQPCWCYPAPVFKSGVFTHHPIGCQPLRDLLTTIKDDNADHI